MSFCHPPFFSTINSNSRANLRRGLRKLTKKDKRKIELIFGVKTERNSGNEIKNLDKSPASSPLPPALFIAYY
jgi:hypothetical protein